MPPLAQPTYTPAEYLTQERTASPRSEFLDGKIFAMSGASRRHNLICLNLGAELRNALRDRPCEVYCNDMRVKVSATGLYTYPDVVVACDDPTFEDEELDTLLDPILLVEVLSPTTADYDRGGKFEHYRALASLQEYLLVDQHRAHLVHYFRRDETTWLLSETAGLEARLNLRSLGAGIELREIYAKVELDSSPSTDRV